MKDDELSRSHYKTFYLGCRGHTTEKIGLVACHPVDYNVKDSERCGDAVKFGKKNSNKF